MVTSSRGPDDDVNESLARLQAALAADDADQAELASLDVLAAAADWAESEDSLDWRLEKQAAACEQAGDWEGAEHAYRQILDLPDVEPATRLTARRHLAALARLLGRLDEAVEHAAEATRAARQCDLPILVGQALLAEAGAKLRRGDVDGAEAAAQESRPLLETENAPAPMLADFYLTSASLGLARGATDAARLDLDRARALLAPQAHLEFAAGIQHRLARCARLEARLLAAGSDLRAALDAAGEAWRLFRLVSELPQSDDVHSRADVAAAHGLLAELLRADSRHAEAERQEAERRRLLAALGLPDDAA